MNTSPVKLSTRNIMRVFREASSEDLAAGLVWYESARLLAVELDASDPKRAAAVIAVLSPLKSWPQNVKLARAAYAGEPVRTLGNHVRKVQALLNGADPDTIVQGDKVRAFWHSIIDPSNPESVALDRHALAVAAYRPLSDSERSPYAKGKRYRETAQLYVRAAKIASRETGQVWTPCTLQAATWCHWRKHHAVAYHGD